MGKGVFFTSASIFLALTLTITTTFRHRHHHPTVSPATATATESLHSHGFHFTANFLHISPQSSVPLTIFALPESAISNLSIPPYILKHLLTYHTSPSKFTFQDLLNKPLKSCLPTLLQHHTLTLTNKNPNLEINHVSITHPDLFLQPHLAIHGVSSPFASFDHTHHHRLTFPSCKSDLGSKTNVQIMHNFMHTDEWKRMVRFLSSSGFMPFAIGLNSVMDRIGNDFPDLNSATLFTPPNVALMAMSSPLLDKFMRFHIVPQRHLFKQLVGLAPGASLPTLVSGKHVDITENSRVSQVVYINGVAITASDLFVSKNFVVHGIARPLNMDELSSVYR